MAGRRGMPRGQRAQVARRVRALLAPGGVASAATAGGEGRQAVDLGRDGAGLSPGGTPPSGAIALREVSAGGLPAADASAGLSTAGASAGLSAAEVSARGLPAAGASAGLSAGEVSARGLPAGGLSGWLLRRGIRFDPGPRAAAAVGIAAIVAGLFAGWWLFHDSPQSAPVSSGAPTAVVSSVPVAPSAAVASGAPSGAVVVVDVVGKVRHPGVYRLPAGARVDDVLRAAGGVLANVDLSSLNLARQIGDGEQIAVGVPPAPGSSGTGSAPAGLSAASGRPGAAGPVDLNTATLEQLDGLPGVGPVLAQRILDWRAAHGRFDSVDQLREVTGIGPSRFDDLRPLVTV